MVLRNAVGVMGALLNSAVFALDVSDQALPAKDRNPDQVASGDVSAGHLHQVSVLNRTALLAKVASSVISTRLVHAYYYFRNPDRFPKQFMTGDEGEEYLQQMVLQTTIFEEYRILAPNEVKKPEIQRTRLQFQRALGARYLSYVRYFDLSEDEIDQMIHRFLLQEKAVESRIRLLRMSSPRASLSESDLEKGLQDWVEQLRTKARVRYFQYSKSDFEIQLPKNL